MILDTSAIMAIVLNEGESEAFLRAIATAPVRRMSVGTWVELGVVVQRRHPARAPVVDTLLRSGRVLSEPASVEQAEIAREAYRIYGQASGHRARLNFGDCFAYALAKATGEPLLFKGDDFVHTDVTSAA
ncbi:type II toxin-antitoxin system VapC family toxin [Sphingomonas sp. HF-S4]|uniref:Ribonuclease VapC n=1 Tax=Sphingomonas agrestis TaxID=3080540 RepID=A0ABU3Y3X2_9SPHN|nr:type II toxin-antitoxin system VapC family toxin [Sphingomonas sp. HF-S4]MDV3455918.1 type II toxin-antitoxin system VapC family toxin [Sphingomonas sp. HF-S4]